MGENYYGWVKPEKYIHIEEWGKKKRSGIRIRPTICDKCGAALRGKAVKKHREEGCNVSNKGI